MNGILARFYIALVLFLLFGCRHNAPKAHNYLHPAYALHHQYKSEEKIFNDVKSSYIGGLNQEKVKNLIVFQKTADSLTHYIDRFQNKLLQVTGNETISLWESEVESTAQIIKNMHSYSETTTLLFGNDPSKLISTPYSAVDITKTFDEYNAKLLLQAKNSGIRGFPPVYGTADYYRALDIEWKDFHETLYQTPLHQLLTTTERWKVDVLHAKRTYLLLLINSEQKDHE